MFMKVQQNLNEKFIIKWVKLREMKEIQCVISIRHPWLNLHDPELWKIVSSLTKLESSSYSLEPMFSNWKFSKNPFKQRTNPLFKKGASLQHHYAISERHGAILKLSRMRKVCSTMALHDSVLWRCYYKIRPKFRQTPWRYVMVVRHFFFGFLLQFMTYRRHGAIWYAVMLL